MLYSKRDDMKNNEGIEQRKCRLCWMKRERPELYKKVKPMRKIILDLCGGTGAWSKPYKDAGYDVRVITLPEQDVRLYNPPKNVYGILAAPPCTMFSFARTHAKKSRNLNEGMSTILACLRIIWQCQYQIKKDVQRKPPLKFWALENPYGMLNWFLGNATLTFHPYEYGDGYSKKTCIWGYFNIPMKTHTEENGRIIKKKFDMLLMPEIKKIRSIGDEIYKNAKTRQELRGVTPTGFAKAFFEANK